MDMKYSRLERFFAFCLSNSPIIKSVVKKFYQKLNYFFYKKSYTYKTNLDITDICKENENFFGYYDKSPINISGEFIIMHEVRDIQTKELPSNSIAIDVVLFDCVNGKVIKKFSSCAYNWQQGTKLMWIDSYRFIFNDYDECREILISKVVDVKKLDVVQVLDKPIYDVHEDYALTLNFFRLNLLRPDYGYRNKIINIDFCDNKEDGIYYVDVQSNTSKLLLSLNDIIDFHCKKNMKNAKHWVNHIMISPAGDKFMFLHRWLIGNIKYDALLVSDVEGNIINCIADDGMVSHCFWKDNNTIISYLRDGNMRDNYYSMDIESGEKKILMNGCLGQYGDGHPNIYNNKMIFDTYPNKSRMKELFLYDLDSEKLEKLGEFYESFKYSEETRCDLHPKFSIDGKNIFIDSVHTGKRKLYKISLNQHNDKN